ncbi:MAG: ATP-binding cassette domain-containing protein [Phycisphaerae bacterium]
MIELVDLCASSGDKVILDNINCFFEIGSRYVISGPSGAGKSSLLMAIAGILPSTSGVITFRGEQVTHANISEIRSQIGFVSQEPDLGNGTALDAIMMPFSFKANRNKRPAVKSVEDVLYRLGLDETILDKSVKIISGGEKQRVALARAILLGKRIFMLDEPTSALDPHSKQRLIEELSDDSYTVLSVSHDPDWTEFCNRKIEMNEGRIV